MLKNKNKIIKTIHRLNVLKRLSGLRPDIVAASNMVSTSKWALFVQALIAVATISIAYLGIQSLYANKAYNDAKTRLIESKIIFNRATIVKEFLEAGKIEPIKDFLKRREDKSLDVINDNKTQLLIDSHTGRYEIKHPKGISPPSDTLYKVITSEKLAFGIYCKDEEKIKNICQDAETKYIISIELTAVNKKGDEFTQNFHTKKPFTAQDIIKKSSTPISSVLNSKYYVINSFFKNDKNNKNNKNSQRTGISKWLENKLYSKLDDTTQKRLFETNIKYLSFSINKQ